MKFKLTASVGFFVGLSEGTGVGTFVGSGVGTPVGAGVEEVGLAVTGLSVGVLVGTTGDFEGEGVGCFVGESVGSFVGESVGSFVGLGVGCRGLYESQSEAPPEDQGIQDPFWRWGVCNEHKRDISPGQSSARSSAPELASALGTLTASGPARSYNPCTQS